VAPSSRTEEESYDASLLGRAPPAALGNVSVEESELLLEKTPIEWTPVLGDRSVVARIKAFERFVETDIEDVAVVVGHSQYFRRMLKQEKKFDNCDIWECTYEFDPEKKGQGEGVWTISGRVYKGNEVGDDEETSKTSEARV
jgi:hypothetical protein